MHTIQPRVFNWSRKSRGHRVWLDQVLTHPDFSDSTRSRLVYTFWDDRDWSANLSWARLSKANCAMWISGVVQIAYNIGKFFIGSLAKSRNDGQMIRLMVVDHLIKQLEHQSSISSLSENCFTRSRQNVWRQQYSAQSKRCSFDGIDVVTDCNGFAFNTQSIYCRFWLKSRAYDPIYTNNTKTLFSNTRNTCEKCVFNLDQIVAHCLAACRIYLFSAVEYCRISENERRISRQLFDYGQRLFRAGFDFRFARNLASSLFHKCRWWRKGDVGLCYLSVSWLKV